MAIFIDGIELDYDKVEDGTVNCFKITTSVNSVKDYVQSCGNYVNYTDSGMIAESCLNLSTASSLIVGDHNVQIGTEIMPNARIFLDQILVVDQWTLSPTPPVNLTVMVDSSKGLFIF